MSTASGRGPLVLPGNGSRCPRPSSAFAPRGPDGGMSRYLTKAYSDPTLAIYLILCMGDIIKLKIYSGRGEVRQQYAILRVPRQRSATLRAARPYAKFADLTQLLGGLDEKSTNRLRYDTPYTFFVPSLINLGPSRKKVLGSISFEKKIGGGKNFWGPPTPLLGGT